MTDPKPKNCPFCGCNVVHVYGKLDMRLRKMTVGNNNGKGVGYVFRAICPDCEARGPCCHNEKEAVRFWNGMLNMHSRSEDFIDLYE